jgi:hypothetical protein
MRRRHEILDTGIDVLVHLFGLVKSTVPRAVVERIERGDENIRLLDKH